MRQPSIRGVATTLSGKALGLGTAFLGARLLIALALPSHGHAREVGLAQELHPTAQPTMMSDMEIKPSGDIDRDFVAMMSPHHQGAIDMAIAELRYGKNEQLRRIAQEIIVDQMQEIAAMKLAIGEPVTTSSPAPTQQQPAAMPAEHHHSGMQMGMSSATMQ